MIINEDFFDDLNSEEITTDEIDDIVSHEDEKYSYQICLSIWDSGIDYTNTPYEKIVDEICKPLRKKVIYLFDYLPYIKEHGEPVFIIHAKNKKDISDKIYTHNGILYQLGETFCGHTFYAIQFNIKINHNIHSVKVAYKFAEVLLTKLYNKTCYSYLDCGDKISLSYLSPGLAKRDEYTLWNDYDYSTLFINHFERWCKQLGFFPDGNDIRKILNTYPYEFKNLFDIEVKNISDLKKINLKKEILTDGSCIDSFLDIYKDDVEVSAMCFPNYTYDLNQGKSTYKSLEDFRKLLNETPSEVVLKPVFGICAKTEIMALIFIFKHIYQEIDTYDKGSGKEYNTMYAIRVDLEPVYLVNKYFDKNDITEFVNYMRPVERIGFDTKKIISEIFKKVQGNANKSAVDKILKKVKEAEGK